VSVGAHCTISTSPVAFGQYDSVVAHRTRDLNAAGAITITCVKGTMPTVALGRGTNAAGPKRRMRAAPGRFLDYELYQPASNTPGAPCTYSGAGLWGSSAAGLFSPGAAPTKQPRTFNVCGTVAAGQDPRPGDYVDTVVATVNF
jgi:spore coat protein U-like protein